MVPLISSSLLLYPQKGCGPLYCPQRSTLPSFQSNIVCIVALILPYWSIHLWITSDYIIVTAHTRRRLTLKVSMAVGYTKSWVKILDVGDLGESAIYWNTTETSWCGGPIISHSSAKFIARYSTHRTRGCYRKDETFSRAIIYCP